MVTHPAVKDAGVIGVEEEGVGELPTAFIVKQPHKEVSEAELLEFVAGGYPIKQLLTIIAVYVRYVLKYVNAHNYAMIMRYGASDSDGGISAEPSIDCDW